MNEFVHVWTFVLLTLVLFATPTITLLHLKAPILHLVIVSVLVGVAQSMNLSDAGRLFLIWSFALGMAVKEYLRLQRPEESAFVWLIVALPAVLVAVPIAGLILTAPWNSNESAAQRPH